MNRLQLGAVTGAAPPCFHLLHAPSAFIQENSVGRVPVLCPQGAELRLVRALRRAWSPQLLLALREHYLRRLAEVGGELGPGRLQAIGHDGREAPVPATATLICACPAERAHRGRCHRWWAAPVLARAGWEVEVDGFAVGALRDYSGVACTLKEELGYHVADLQLEGMGVRRDWNYNQVQGSWAWRMSLSIRDRHGRQLLDIHEEDSEEEAATCRMLMGLRRWASEQAGGRGEHRLAS